jgi:putative Mg2+ transporter-C (MgtC) family protein
VTVEPDRFFGLHLDLLSLVGKAVVLTLAILIGGLIGFERQWHGNAAGLRTHILVCVGSTIITLSSVEIGLGVRGGMRGDPGHIAAQIVSGIGFLGAGAILREGLTVHGLTTAASIWATAGMGIALGASGRLAELAVIGAAVVLVTLTLLRNLEDVLKLRQAVNNLHVEVHESNRGPARVLELLAAQGLTVYGVQSEAGPASLKKGSAGASRIMEMRVKLPPHFDRSRFNTELTELDGVVSFHLN